MEERSFDQEVELEQLLAQGLSAPPEEPVLRQIGPWRRSLGRILTGIALGTVTLNFWGLNFLLPALGQLLILLGLRPLRRESGAFRLWWRLELVRGVLMAFRLLRLAAPGWQDFYRAVPGLIIAGVGGVLDLIQPLCLWQSLRGVRRRAGLLPGVWGALILAVCDILLIGLGLLGVSDLGWFFFLCLLAVYIGVFFSLFRLSRELDEAGYGLRPAPVRVAGRPLALGLAGALLAGIAAVCLTCDRLPMDWQAADPAEQAQVEDLRAELAGMGFPEAVLDDLSAEDLLAFSGAVRVISDVHIGGDRYELLPESLTITSVAVEFPGEPVRWRILHHFSWAEGTEFHSTEAIDFWPAYFTVPEGWRCSARATGRVLCDRDGTAVWSPYHFLGNAAYTADSLFFGGRHTARELFASFSFPRDGEHCRGYVTYEVEGVISGAIIWSDCSYIHAQGTFQYPVMTAMEWQMEGHWPLASEPFHLYEDELQFYPQHVEEEGLYSTWP